MRIDGVEQVKGSKYIMLHAPRSALAAIAKLLPGSEAPTVIPLEGPRRPGGGARRVPRKRVLGDAGRPEGRGRDLGAGSAGRKNAGLGPRSHHANSRLELICPRRSAKQALRRPALRDAAAVAACARDIIEAVRRDGDAALLALTEKFDGVRLSALQVTRAGIRSRRARVERRSRRGAIERAIANVRRFHAAQDPRPLRIETSPGVICERFSVPIRAVGLYVPAGSAPLPSTAIMLAVPAAHRRLPGAGDVHAADARRRARTPRCWWPRARPGVEQVFKVGGAQAIAAMAYGTASIPKCDKIFGPGNAWVTAAKMLVAQDAGGRGGGPAGRA